jgi:outer membrane protein OmpA-like peptidoglycan-associated protein
VLQGKITDCKSRKAIENATVKLICSNGEKHEVMSDSLGFYTFNILKPGLSYIVSVFAPADAQHKKEPFGKCPYDYNISSCGEYLNSSEKKKFNTNDSILKFSYDFCLVEIIRCGWILPSFYFQKNSTEFTNFKRADQSLQFASDTAIDCFITFLMNNPHYTVEISGHADKKEKNAKELSALRAKKVFDLISGKGIDQNRLKIKGYGDAEPAEIKNEEGRVTGTYTGESNQRVVIYLLSKDYDLPPPEDAEE